MKGLMTIAMTAMLWQCSTESFAQKYIVYSITGNVDVVMNKKTRRLRLREELSPQTVLNIPYHASLELVDDVDNRKYDIYVSGQGRLADILKSKNTSVINLTEAYMRFLKSQIQSKGTAVTVRCSDPATITRHIEVFDSVIVDSVPQVQPE